MEGFFFLGDTSPIIEARSFQSGGTVKGGVEEEAARSKVRTGWQKGKEAGNTSEGVCHPNRLLNLVTLASPDPPLDGPFCAVDPLADLLDGKAFIDEAEEGVFFSSRPKACRSPPCCRKGKIRMVEKNEGWEDVPD